MALSIDWLTKVISVPQADLTSLGGGVYELDVEDLRLWLKDIEDGEDGMAQPDTHRRNAPVTLAGVTYAQTFEIINGYTVAFQNTGTPYLIKCVGGNHNLGDVTIFDGGSSLLIGNSAGLQLVSTGGGSDVWSHALSCGYTAEQAMQILTAVAAGKSTITDLGGGDATVTFRDLQDTRDVVDADMTGSERTTVDLDP